MMKVTVQRNEETGCTNGIHDIYTVDGVEYLACRCGNGCNDTTPLEVLDKIVTLKTKIAKGEELLADPNRTGNNRKAVKGNIRDWKQQLDRIV